MRSGSAETMDAAKFKLGMRRLASGVTLITTVSGGERHGLVATAVSSLSADPPTLLTCVNQSASAHTHIAASGIFCVNVLSASQKDVAARFSNSSERHRRFQDGDWQALMTGAPALAGSLVSFDCKLRQSFEHNSHTIFIGEIVCVELWASSIRPLVYMDGSYRDIAGEPLELRAANGS
jgi:flavin reductase